MALFGKTRKTDGWISIRLQSQQVQAEQLADGYAKGTQNDLHGTMIAVEKAHISLKLLANVRNRALEAYREIMRMGA